ncbi:hypothetical protein AB0H60_31650 [Nocardia rhamnosiphila]|uniref:hypothetical protein n=1 Tax=Nocardia rhamnosiphila TaxID=426716 RepID=UPI003410B07D
MLRRSTTTTVTPDQADALVTGALPERKRIAHERLAHQDDPALLEALSERELGAARSLAEEIREHKRSEQLARVQAAADAAKRVRETANKLAEREAADLLRAAEAIGEQRHSSSPHAKVARLHQRKSRILALLAAVVAGSMLFSAVTVQQNIAPGVDMGNPMFWLSYGLEALISAVLVALMLSTADTAEWNVIDKAKMKQVYAVEGVLLAASVGLNTFPYIRAKDEWGFCVHVVAPVMIGVALVTHRIVADRYGRAIEAATAAIPNDDDLQLRLASLTRVGDAGNDIFAGVLAGPAVEQRRSITAEQTATQPATEHLPAAAEQPAQHTAEHDPRPVLRSSGAPAPERSGAEQAGAAQRSPAGEWSTPANGSEHSAADVDRAPATAGTEEAGPVTEPLPVLRTAQQDTAPQAQPEPAALAADAPAADAIEDNTVFEAEVIAAGPERNEREEEAPAVSGKQLAAALDREYVSIAAVRRAAQAAVQHSAPQADSATAARRSAQQRSNAVEQRAEQSWSTTTDAEQSAPAVRSSRATMEQSTGATQHPAEHAESGEITEAVRQLAGEVKEAAGARASVEHIARAIAYQDATGHSPSRVARDVGAGFKSVNSWLTTAAEIRRERSGARVIHLHNG